MATAIQWTDETWNPTTGCDRVSPGCDHCYALTLAKRLKAMGQARYQNDGDPRTSGPGFGLTMHADALDLPLRWRKPRRVFVDSMSDLFHPGVDDSFIADVFGVMAACQWTFVPECHTFQVLTKRPQRMANLLRRHDWWDGVADRERANLSGLPITRLGDGIPVLRNVWLGTSVEDDRYARVRIPHLLRTSAAVRFLSVEPLLGPVDLWPYLDSIQWVIIGGESGPGARPMDLEWAERIVSDCRAAGAAVFVKQLGTVTGGKHHHDIDTFPESLRVREYPQPLVHN